MKPKSVKSLYDEISRQYHENRARAVGDYTELPAVIRLAGDVKGRRVLDAGCGPGRHSKRLIELGADVTGIDASLEMVNIARAYCDDRGEFFAADFERARFKRQSFDLIIASLCLMYSKDLNPAIRNFGRWLKPAGRLIFSIYHPVRFLQKITDFDFSKRRKVWIHLHGCDVTVFNYYHPTESYFGALVEHGFGVRRLIEPVLSRRYKGWPEDNYRVPRSMVIEAVKL